MPRRRTDEILKEMQALINDSQRLLREHKKLAAKYERLKHELGALNGKAHSDRPDFDLPGTRSADEALVDVLP